MDSYLNETRVKESVSVFKKFIEKSEEKSSDVKKKALDPTSVQQLQLQIVWKKIPPNNTTYDNSIGPLPYHWFDKSDCDVCLIVRDPNPKVFLKDRELDLNETRDYYKDKLIAAGFDDDFLSQKMNIIPMRELITEYKEYEAKSKLCAAYDVFLVDHSLMNHKNKSLNTFLGYKFFVERKKVPVPIKIRKLEREELKNEIMNALHKTHLVITGKGSDCCVKIGLMDQTVKELSANLTVVLEKLKQLYGDNVAMLKLKTPRSAAIPIYADLRTKSDVSLANFPRSVSAFEYIRDEFPLFNHTDLVFTKGGNFKLKRRADSINDERDPEEQFLNALEKRWIKITNPRKKKRRLTLGQSDFKRSKVSDSEEKNMKSENENVSKKEKVEA